MVNGVLKQHPFAVMNEIKTDLTFQGGIDATYSESFNMHVFGLNYCFVLASSSVIVDISLQNRSDGNVRD